VRGELLQEDKLCSNMGGNNPSASCPASRRLSQASGSRPSPVTSPGPPLPHPPARPSFQRVVQCRAFRSRARHRTASTDGPRSSGTGRASGAVGTTGSRCSGLGRRRRSADTADARSRFSGLVAHLCSARSTTCRPMCRPRTPSQYATPCTTSGKNELTKGISESNLCRSGSGDPDPDGGSAIPSEQSWVDLVSPMQPGTGKG